MQKFMIMPQQTPVNQYESLDEKLASVAPSSLYKCLFLNYTPYNNMCIPKYLFFVFLKNFYVNCIWCI